jgi:predicted nucleic acid-binding protein
VIVVSDTTPLNYLVLIDVVTVLPKLFDDVVAPASVMRELVDARTRDPVRAWAANPPDWLRILAPSSRLPSTAQLDPGEADAISLAKEVKAPAVLLDERSGRKVALAEGARRCPNAGAARVVRSTGVDRPAYQSRTTRSDYVPRRSQIH